MTGSTYKQPGPFTSFLSASLVGKDQIIMSNVCLTTKMQQCTQSNNIIKSASILSSRTFKNKSRNKTMKSNTRASTNVNNPIFFSNASPSGINNRSSSSSNEQQRDSRTRQSHEDHQDSYSYHPFDTRDTEFDAVLDILDRALDILDNVATVELPPTISSPLHQNSRRQ